MSDTVTVRLDDTTLQALDRIANATERSRDLLVTEAVEDYVALNAWQMSKIEAGIAAADRGELASDGEVIRVREKFASRG